MFWLVIIGNNLITNLCLITVNLLKISYIWQKFFQNYKINERKKKYWQYNNKIVLTNCSLAVLNTLYPPLTEEVVLSSSSISSLFRGLFTPPPEKFWKKIMKGCINRGITSEQKKVVKSEIEIVLPKCSKPHVQI